MRFRSEHKVEPGDSDRRGNHAKVLHLLAEKDNLDRVTPSQCFSSDIGKDPIGSVVKYQCGKFKVSGDVLFVAAVMAETIEIWNKSQTIRALRFLSSDGEICAIFVRFCNASDDRTAVGRAKHLLCYKNELNCGNNSVFQTKDVWRLWLASIMTYRNLPETKAFQLSSSVVMLTN